MYGDLFSCLAFGGGSSASVAVGVASTGGVVGQEVNELAILHGVFSAGHITA